MLRTAQRCVLLLLLAAGVNERLVFHGTSPSIADTIAREVGEPEHTWHKGCQVLDPCSACVHILVSTIWLLCVFLNAYMHICMVQPD